MQYREITDRAEFRALIQHYNEMNWLVAIDLETDGLNERKCKILNLVMSNRPQDAVMVPGEWASDLAGLSPNLLLIFQNFKFDLKVLKANGVDLFDRNIRDTMLLHHLLDENSPHGLDHLVQHYYKDNYKAKFWEKYKKYEEATPEDKLEYACKDVIYTRELYCYFDQQLHNEDIPRTLIDLIHNFAKITAQTEFNGIKLDNAYLFSLGTELKTAITGILGEMRRSAEIHIEACEMDDWAKKIDKLYTPKGKKWQTLPKPEFDFESPKQVSRLLYNYLKLPAQFHRKTKQITCDDSALEKISHLHPLVAKLQDFRVLQKIYGTFVEGVAKKAENGRIYPEFNINGTVTGRISHCNPNMGQMPSKGEWAKVRGIFVPDPDYVFITADYRQLEVCVNAHFSKDEQLLKIIFDGASQHDITAESLKIERSKAKTLNFAMQYQCSPYKVAEILGVPIDEGKHAWNVYWSTYKGVADLIQDCNLKVDAGLPIVTLSGRKRRLPKEFSQNWERASAYRQAFSALIQGSGADLTTMSAVNINACLVKQGLGRVLFTIHDENVILCKKSETAVVREIVKREMELAPKLMGLSVPLTCEVSEGLERWQK